MKVEVAVLGSPSLISLMWTLSTCLLLQCFRAQELCESRGGRPWLPVPNIPCGLCGRKATMNLNSLSFFRTTTEMWTALPSQWNLVPHIRILKVYIQTGGF